MFIGSRVSDFAKAVRQAQANADHFKRAYLVFTDTNGNWHCERDDGKPKDYRYIRVEPYCEKRAR